MLLLEVLLEPLLDDRLMVEIALVVGNKEIQAVIAGDRLPALSLGLKKEVLREGALRVRPRVEVGEDIIVIVEPHAELARVAHLELIRGGDNGLLSEGFLGFEHASFENEEFKRITFEARPGPRNRFGDGP